MNIQTITPRQDGRRDTTRRISTKQLQLLSFGLASDAVKLGKFDSKTKLWPAHGNQGEKSGTAYEEEPTSGTFTSKAKKLQLQS